MNSWRLTTWNVHGASNPNISTLAEVIEQHRVDVLCLQEIRPYQAKRLAKHLGWHFFWSRKHFPLTPLIWWRAEGLAVMSPHQLSRQRRLALTPQASSLTFRNRISQSLTIERRGVPLAVVNTHLASDAAGLERLEQARKLCSLLGHVDVLAGDLNSAHEPPVIAALSKLGLRDAWNSTDDPGYTSEALLPRQRIDYVMVRDEAMVIEATVPPGGKVWAAMSDHLPLTVEFRLVPSSDEVPNR